MNSKFALLLPLITLVYLLQALFRKNLKGFFKVPIVVASIGVLVLDVFVYLVFSVNCVEMSMRYKTEFDCIPWVYPTLDFTVMVILSLLALVFALLGISRDWSRQLYFTLGSVVLLIGVIARLFVLVGASDAISMTRGSSNFLVFEIFSIVVVYGLISSAVYFIILMLGFLKGRIPQ